MNFIGSSPITMFIAMVVLIIGAGGARFMCSWDTEEARVRELAADIRKAMA